MKSGDFAEQSFTCAIKQQVKPIRWGVKNQGFIFATIRSFYTLIFVSSLSSSDLATPSLCPYSLIVVRE
jgi:hypothetical protein